MTQRLIADKFLPAFNNTALAEGNDFARVQLNQFEALQGKLSISTDAHVITPLFYPGGDIGRLSVCGTVNDVAMSGAIPLYLTASFIIEEGLPIAHLEIIIASMQEAAREAGVKIIAGDTKVVEKGKADGVFISTTGVGYIPAGIDIAGSNAKPGDAVLISGTLGDHGIAVLSARGHLAFETEVISDQSPLNELIQQVLQKAPDIHVMRDPTRGGLATTLNEIACQSNVSIQIDETALPVSPAVRTACELLGFDPLYVANEGKVIIILPPERVDDVLRVMRNHKYGKAAQLIGFVTDSPEPRVLLKTRLGTRRVLNVLSGELLPRIC